MVLTMYSKKRVEELKLREHLSEQSHSQVVRDDDEREETEINFNTFHPQHNIRVK